MDGLRDAHISNRAKVDRLLDYACTNDGFCGGSERAADRVAVMKAIGPESFAMAVLLAEGFTEAARYETEWFQYFATMFQDVFGSDEVELE